MSNNEAFKALLKLAEKQQRKMAQQAMPKATVEDFQSVLDSVKTAPGSQMTKITSAEALLDGSYDVRITGSLTTPEMDAFVASAAAKFTGNDKLKMRVIRMMDMPWHK